MAQRKVQRAGKPQPRAKLPGKAVSRTEPRSSDGWRREVERLKAELEAARQEIASLHARQDEVLNRIDWVLDSLDSLSQSDS